MRRLSVLVGLLAALMAGACARPGSAQPVRDADGIIRTAGCSIPSTPPATEMFGTPQPVNQNYLDDIDGRIRPYVERHFVGVYAGLANDSPGNRVRVYRVPSAAFDAWIAGAFADVCVEVVDAKHSAAELDALANRINDDQAYWTSVGVPIYWTDRPEDGTAVHVATSADDVAKARQLLPQRYGPDAPIDVVPGQPSMLQRVTRA
jgi:hypothetical protein